MHMYMTCTCCVLIIGHVCAACLKRDPCGRASSGTERSDRMPDLVIDLVIDLVRERLGHATLPLVAVAAVELVAAVGETAAVGDGGAPTSAVKRSSEIKASSRS